jgi:hypothetical protein
LRALARLRLECIARLSYHPFLSSRPPEKLDNRVIVFIDYTKYFEIVMNNLIKLKKSGDYSWQKNRTRFQPSGFGKLVAILEPF